MKNIIIFFLSVLLIGCNSSNTIEIKEDGLVIESYKIDQDSLRHGQTIKYYPSGQSFELSTYVHGKLDGERLLYYENGNIEIKENYCLGMFCDTLTTYYPNGKKKFVGVYNHGIMTGMVKGFYQTGELKEEVTFIDNIEQGAFTEYYKNGQKKWEGTYLNGPNEYGILTEYDTAGIKIKLMECDTLAVCRTIWNADAPLMKNP
ncbi:MAG: hypothetical protein V3V00_03555 [Saprospiraceae bacterium]